MSAYVLRWYHKAALILMIAFVPLFALISAVTQEEQTYFIKCEDKNGPLVHGVVKMWIDSNGTMYVENEKINAQYQLKNTICFIAPVPDEQSL